MGPSQTSVVPAADAPLAWDSTPCWRVLDSCFQDGELFFATWSSWVEDPQRPHLLHYVAITPAAPAPDVLLRTLTAFRPLAAHAADLHRQWVGLVPGFHRIVLQRGQVLLTLCIGPMQSMLREQQFMADAVCLPAAVTEARQVVWDRWNIKALTRLCRRGTWIHVGTAPAMLQSELEQAGFVFENTVGSDGSVMPPGHPATALRGQYQPRWEPGSTRHPWRQAPAAASSCVVVGAGLAGALVAAALARRGWQVTVLDAGAQPASAASSLPVGLFAQQVSRDDSTRSRLSRAGVRATLQMCEAWLHEGDDWSLSGVLELQRNQGFAPIHHAAAGWIKPARLVQACLARPGVQFIGNSDVQKAVREGGHWELSGADGKLLGRARCLVVAGAAGSVELLDCAADAARQSRGPILRMAAMQRVSGLVSWGLHQAGDSAAFPPIPVNGQGSFVAHVPNHGARAWFAGATYETVEAATMRTAEGHDENLQRLSRLLPQVARRLTKRFSQSQVQAWTGTRCTTIDRLPAVGALDAGSQPNLWVSTGFGSRGLTYAALCAELLAAQLGGEPVPVEASLAKCIAATRPQLLHHP
jgi:tRNA 5-methylaminomethyl-2-thiouridine biosynthesis bifunctional protein